MYILVVSLAIPNELMSYECFAEYKADKKHDSFYKH